MLELILSAIETNNIALLNFILSLYPQERWDNIDGNGNSVAHYCAAYGIKAEGEWLTAAMLATNPNNLGLTPANIRELRAQQGAAFDTAACGLQRIESKTLAQTVEDEKKTDHPLKKLFFQNVEKILQTGIATENQLKLMESICEKLEGELKEQLTQLVIRLLIISENYKQAEKFYEKVAKKNGDNQWLSFSLLLLNELSPDIPADIKILLYKNLPVKMNNTAIACLFLNSIEKPKLPSLLVRIVEKYVEVFSTNAGLHCFANNRSALVDIVDNLSVYLRVFVRIINSLNEFMQDAKRITQEELESFIQYQSIVSELLTTQLRVSIALNNNVSATPFGMFLNNAFRTTSTLVSSTSKLQARLDTEKMSDEPFAQNPVWHRFDHEEKNLTNAALIWAIRRNELPMMKKLFALIDEEFATSGIDGSSLFHFIASEGSRAAMECFLENVTSEFAAVNLKAPDRKGHTPLEHARMSNNREMLAFFKEKKMTSKAFRFAPEISEGNLKMAAALMASMQEGSNEALECLRHAIDARQLQLFPLIFSKLNCTQLSNHALDILKLINARFADSRQEAIHALITQLNDERFSIAIYERFLHATVLLNDKKLLFQLFDHYLGSFKVKQTMLAELCFKIKVTNIDNPKEDKIPFIYDFMARYYDVLDVYGIGSEFERLDKIHGGDFKLDEIGILVFQFKNPGNLPPGALSQARLALLIDDCHAGKPVDQALFRSILDEVNAVGPDIKGQLFKNLLFRFKMGLINSFKDNLNIEIKKTLLKLAIKLITDNLSLVLDEERLIFANFAFVLDEFRVAFDLLPNLASSTHLWKLINFISRMNMLFFSDFKVVLPPTIVDFHHSSIALFYEHNFIFEVGLRFLPEELDFSGLTNLKKLEEILNQIKQLKFSRKGAAPSKELAQQFNYSLDFIFQFLVGLQNNIIDVNAKTLGSERNLKKLRQLKSACDATMLAIHIFNAILKSYNSAFSQYQMQIDEKHFNTAKLLRVLNKCLSHVTDDIFHIQYPEKKVKEKNVETEVKSDGKGGKNEKNPHLDSSDEEFDISKVVPLPTIIIQGVFSKPRIKRPLPAGIVTKEKTIAPVVTVVKEDPIPRREAEAKKEVKIAKPTVAVAKSMPPVVTSSASAPMTSTPVKSQRTLRVQPRHVATAQSLNPTMFPVLNPSAFFAASMPYIIVEPFNKISPHMIHLMRYLDSIPAQKSFRPFEEVPKGINCLLVGGTIRDCFWLDILDGDGDFWVSLTTEQIEKAFPQAQKSEAAGGCTYSLNWFGIDVDLTPVDPDKLDEKFAQCDFTINRRGYHPLLPALVDKDKKAEHATIHRYLDHISDEKNIFTKYPKRILRLIRFETKYDPITVSPRIETEIAFLRATDNIENLIRLIPAKGLHEEYAKLLKACMGDVEYAKSQLERRGIYDVMVDLKIIPVVSSIITKKQ